LQESNTSQNSCSEGKPKINFIAGKRIDGNGDCWQLKRAKPSLLTYRLDATKGRIHGYALFDTNRMKSDRDIERTLIGLDVSMAAQLGKLANG